MLQAVLYWEPGTLILKFSFQAFADLIHPGRSWWVKQVVIEKCISTLLNFGLPPDLNDVAAAPSTVSKVLVNLRMIGGTSMEVIWPRPVEQSELWSLVSKYDQSWGQSHKHLLFVSKFRATEILDSYQHSQFPFWLTEPKFCRDKCWIGHEIQSNIVARIVCLEEYLSSKYVKREKVRNVLRKGWLEQISSLDPGLLWDQLGDVGMSQRQRLGQMILQIFWIQMIHC